MARIQTYATDSSISGSEKLLGTDAGTTKLFSLTDLRSYFTSNTSAGTTFTGDIVPDADDSHDIGSSSAQWQDIYIDGIAYIDQLGTDGDPVGPAYISGGEIDGVAIGSESPSTGAFTTITSSGLANFNSLQVNGAALSLNYLSDVLIETNSMYLGHDPSSTTSTAQYNIAVGVTALDAITTGDSNTVVGYAAGTAITTGSQNTAIGTSALQTNTVGSSSTAVGHWALKSHDVGGSAETKNTALGAFAGQNITTGTENTALGYQALQLEDTGTQSVAVGARALYSQNGNGRNVAVGYDSGYAITTGTDNVVIGY